jgi:hypothetical protein
MGVLKACTEAPVKNLCHKIGDDATMWLRQIEVIDKYSAVTFSQWSAK